MTSIERGTRVIVRDAFGQELERRALSGVEPGDTFAIVWACREDEWMEAEADGREPDATPWPAEDVRVAESTVAP